MRELITHPWRRISALILLLAVLTLTSIGHAAEKFMDPVNVKLDGSIKVSPTAIDVGELRAGESVTRTLTVRNRRPYAIDLAVVALGAVGVDATDPSENGRTARFVEADTAGDSAAAWIVPEKASIALKPREAVRMSVRIAVPAGAPQGTRYGAVAVRTAPRKVTAQGAAVGVETEIAVAVAVTVGKRGKPELAIGKPTAPIVVGARTPWPVLVAVSNSGDVHASLVGSVKIRSLTGRTVFRGPLTTRSLLPEAKTVAKTSWTKTPPVGVFRARITTGTSDGFAGLPASKGVTPTAQQPHEMWIVVLPPWWVWIVLALPVLLLVARRVIQKIGTGPDSDGASEDESDVDWDDEA